MKSNEPGEGVAEAGAAKPRVAGDCGAARRRAVPPRAGRKAHAVRLGAPGRAATLVLLPQTRGLVIWTRMRPGDHCLAAGPVDPVDFVSVMARHGLATLCLDPPEADGAGSRPAAAAIQPARGSRDEVMRLVAETMDALDWVAGRADLSGLRTALCAPDLAAAAALVASTQRPAHIAAVVGRSGRPDLAGQALGRVSVPTLLIVGGEDTETVRLNRQALQALNCEKRLEVVPGAGPCFMEPGARATMLHLAAEWLADRLAGGSARH